MKTLYRFGLPLVLGFYSVTGVCQQGQGTAANATILGASSTVKITVPASPDEHGALSPPDAVVLSGTARTARIADPNEPVLFSGRVMRMADFVAAVSSSSATGQNLHIQEMRNREKDQPTPQLSPPGSK